MSVTSTDVSWQDEDSVGNVEVNGSMNLELVPAFCLLNPGILYCSIKST